VKYKLTSLNDAVEFFLSHLVHLD